MELVLEVLSFLGIIVLISLVVAVVAVWVYVISALTYRICERIGEYIERRFRRWY